MSSNYIFNGDFPSMYDILCTMAKCTICKFDNVGQPSYDEQRKFVENAHITFKEIDNLDEWKKKYNVTDREDGFVNLYCDGKKVSDKIYYVPRFNDYKFLKELNLKKFERIGIVEICTYKTKEEVESRNSFYKQKVKIGDEYILTALHSEIISIEDGHTLDIEIGVTSGYIVYDGLYYLNDKQDLYFLPTEKVVLNKGYSDVLESENYVFFEKNGTRYSKGNRTVLKLEKKTGIVEEIV